MTSTGTAATARAQDRRPARRSARPATKKTLSVWSRRLHSWTSMLCMLLILFFAVSGFFLNHPEWTGEGTTTTATGILPAEYLSGQADYLGISEYLRSSEGVTGTAGDHGVTGTEGRIAWASPGSSAAVTFDTSSGAYTLTKTSYGILGWLGDLHTGHNTSDAWSWVTDAAAILLAFVALSGLALQLVIQRRRRQALILLAIGSVITAIIMAIH